MPPRDSDETLFRLVPDRHAVQVGGGEVVLTATQFRILAVLMADPGRVFSREELVKRAFAGPVSGRTVDVHIKGLRRKLGRHEGRVQTVRGQGYWYLGERPRSG